MTRHVQTLKWNEFKAGCSKGGVHVGKSHSFDWPKEASDKVRGYIDSPLKSVIHMNSTQVGNNIPTHLNKLRRDIADTLRNVQRTFLALAPRHQLGKEIVSNMVAQYERRAHTLDTLITDAQVEISRSLVSPSMRLRGEIQKCWGPAFKEASQVKGAGSLNRMGKIVTDGLHIYGVINYPMKKLNQSVIAVGKNILKSLRTDLDQLIEDAQMDYRNVFPEKDKTAEAVRRTEITLAKGVLGDLRRSPIYADL